MKKNLLIILYLIAIQQAYASLGINNIAVTGITETASYVDLAVTGTNNTGEDVTVTLFYGVSDGTTNESNWASSNYYGVSAIETVAVHVTNLSSGTKYYYRGYAEEAGTGVWASTSSNFTTLAYNPTGDVPIVSQSVMTDTNAVLKSPTNFFRINIGLIEELGFITNTITDAGVTNITSDDSSVGVDMTDSAQPDLSITNYVQTELGGYASTGDMVTAEGRLDVLETNTVDRTGARGMQADLNMGGFSVTNVGTNSFTFSDGVEITSTKIQLYDTFETGKINVGSSGTSTNLGDYNNDAGFITSGEADASGWSGYSATQLINRVTTSSIPTLTSLVSDFSDTASGAGWTFDNDYAYGWFSYPSPSGETSSFTMTGLFHSATSAVPDGTISGIEFCQENGSSGWYFTPDRPDGDGNVEGSVTVSVWFVCGTITSDVQTVWTNGTFGNGGTVLNCGPFGSSNDLWGANLSGVSVSDISNITFHVEMSLYPTTTNGIAQFFIGPWLDKLIPETRFWFYEDTTHTFGIDDDGIFKIDDSPALTNTDYGITDAVAYRGDWGDGLSNLVAVIATNYYPLQDGVAASNLAYSASTNAEAARTIATNADAAAGVAYSAATNAQAVAEAALPKAGGTMSGNIAMAGSDITGAGTLTTTNLTVTGGSPTNGAVWMSTGTTGAGEWSTTRSSVVRVQSQTTNTLLHTVICGFQPREIEVIVSAVGTAAFSHGFQDSAENYRCMAAANDGSFNSLPQTFRLRISSKDWARSSLTILTNGISFTPSAESGIPTNNVEMIFNFRQ